LNIRIADVFIGIVFLSVCLFTLISWTFNSDNGNIAVIYTNSGTYEYPLNKDALYRIRGYHGISVIEIKDKAIRFLDSPCKNKTCCKFGFISKNLSISVCVPNRITIKVNSTNKKNSIDTICR